MVRTRSQRNSDGKCNTDGDGKSNTNGGQQHEAGGASRYERIRDQRIKENMLRMQKLGILDLSVKLKSEIIASKNCRRRTSAKVLRCSTPLPSSPTRRSSRLKRLTPVAYSEEPILREKSRKRKEIRLFQGPRPEIYTEEHAELLGSCEKSWTLFVDGYGNDGKRIYDQVKGKTCHQCRQKTLGLHTQCCKCDLVQGQFCGDCLFMRYGENILEVMQNPNWVCPVCRDICNCSLCRNAKGWAPTGALYRKVAALGFKSVAHYLIQMHSRKAEEKELIE